LKYGSLKIGANVRHSFKKKKAKPLFISSRFVIQFFEHFNGKNSLNKKAYKIGRKEGRELQFIHFAIGSIYRIEDDKKQSEFYETACNEKKADIILEPVSKHKQCCENNRCNKGIDPIGTNN